MTVLTLGLAWFVSKEIAKGKVKITLSENELDVKWTRKPIINFQSDKIIKISDITGWRFRPDRNFDMLKIYLKGDQDIKFERDTFWNPIKDDFGRFNGDVKDLVKSENKNRKRNEKAEIVDKEVEYYKSDTAKLLYYFGIALCVGGGLLIFFSDNLDLADTFMLIACMGGGVFFIMRYRQINKKKENFMGNILPRLS